MYNIQASFFKLRQIQVKKNNFFIVLVFVIIASVYDMGVVKIINLMLTD